MPFNARLNALYGSDIGHWDVPDMSAVGREAFELAEGGIISAADFRDFVLTNPVRLWTATNPDFFRGTIVEREAAQLAGAGSAQIAGDALSKA